VSPEQQIKTALDTSIGTIGATSPVWIQYLQQGAGIIAAVGGAALVIIRLLIAWRDWRNGKKGN
jgi:outer membrane lipoprotein SlyB